MWSVKRPLSLWSVRRRLNFDTDISSNVEESSPGVEEIIDLREYAYSAEEIDPREYAFAYEKVEMDPMDLEVLEEFAVDSEDEIDPRVNAYSPEEIDPRLYDLTLKGLEEEEIQEMDPTDLVEFAFDPDNEIDPREEAYSAEEIDPRLYDLSLEGLEEEEMDPVDLMEFAFDPDNEIDLRENAYSPEEIDPRLYDLSLEEDGIQEMDPVDLLEFAVDSEDEIDPREYAFSPEEIDPQEYAFAFKVEMDPLDHQEFSGDSEDEMVLREFAYSPEENDPQDSAVKAEMDHEEDDGDSNTNKWERISCDFKVLIQYCQMLKNKLTRMDRGRPLTESGSNNFESLEAELIALEEMYHCRDFNVEKSEVPDVVPSPGEVVSMLQKMRENITLQAQLIEETQEAMERENARLEKMAKIEEIRYRELLDSWKKQIDSNCDKETLEEIGRSMQMNDEKREVFFADMKKAYEANRWSNRTYYYHPLF